MNHLDCDLLVCFKVQSSIDDAEGAVTNLLLQLEPVFLETLVSGQPSALLLLLGNNLFHSNVVGILSAAFAALPWYRPRAVEKLWLLLWLRRLLAVVPIGLFPVPYKVL